jgi:hypothetical protein
MSEVGKYLQAHDCKPAEDQILGSAKRRDGDAEVSESNAQSALEDLAK